jgi:diguanylate cyclase (GGDEF)-like protein
MRDGADTLPFGLFTGLEVFSPYTIYPAAGDGPHPVDIMGGSRTLGIGANAPAVFHPEFQRSLLAAIIDKSPEGILVVDSAGIVISHNRRFIDIWQISMDGLPGEQGGSAIGQVDEPLLASLCQRLKDPIAFLKRVQELYNYPELDDQCELELKDGRTLERISTVLRGTDDRYLGRVWFFRDVTASRKAQAQLVAMACHDSLTGAMNRRYFEERAKQEFARAAREHRSVAIVEFDLDHFKGINDRHGHASGDEVLKAVSAVCRSMVRQTSLFARIGGEEFAILLTPANHEGTLIFAERLRAAVAGAKVGVRGGEVCVTISLGIAMRHLNDDTVEECLQRADRAMHAAKARGRDRVEFAA